MICAPTTSVQYETAASRVFFSCCGILVLIITVEGGICDVIPEIKTVPEIIADDDETFNLLERVSSIDYAPGEMGVVIGVGVLAAGYSLHPSFIHDIIISIFVSSTYFFRYSSA
ncbi:MAG: hypothetical protein WBE68_13575 [Candidatus Nitrosopolaris sp.]